MQGSETANDTSETTPGEGTADVQRDPAAAGPEIVQLRLDELHPFEGHPFKVLDDDLMEQTARSIRTLGILTPLIARTDPDGGYEILSGHRRLRAAQLAGIEKVPVIIREMDDDAAVIFMVDCNLQRDGLLPSEKAYAYKMKLEAISRTRGRPKKEGQVVPDLFGKRSTEIIAEGTGESYKQVQRYIRLTNLIPELLDMVDDKKISFNPAVELSYLTVKEQENFMQAMEYAQSAPSLSQAQRIKKLSQQGSCSLISMCRIMNEEKKSDLDHVTIKYDVLRKYFPKSYTPKQMEDTIVRLLDQWQKKRNRDQSL